MAGINLFYNFTNPFEKQKEQQKAQKDALIKKNYDEIYAHELAHKSAGGALAGSIVIERNAEGIPFAGHVDIKMPSLNPNNPQKTINDANTVIKSAMAPSDPSDQDYRVAAQAQSIKMQAQAIKDKNVGNKLDYSA
jgi:protein-glutamate O-methyltransferase